MRIAIACVVALILSGCGCFCFQEGVPIGFELTYNTKEVSRAVLTFSDKLKDRHIYLNNSYTYMSEDGRPILWMDFHTQILADVDVARRIMVDMVEGFLVELRDNTDQYPWTHHDLFISVEFESFHGVYVDPLYVGRMELADGNVTCSYAHTGLEYKSFIFHQHFEPYESSLYFVEIERAIEANKPKATDEFSTGGFMSDIPTSENLENLPQQVLKPIETHPPKGGSVKPEKTKRPGWVE